MDDRGTLSIDGNIFPDESRDEVSVYYTTDITWGILEGNKLAGPLFLDTSIYFIALAVGVLFWTQYTVNYLDEKSGFGRFLLYAGACSALRLSRLS